MNKILWQYWEGPKSGFIDLCLDTVNKNNTSFERILLNEKTVKDYLPDLREEVNSLPRIANKADYIRFSLLEKYGGIWIDADVALFKDLNPVWNSLSESEFDFASTSHFGPGRPSVWFMMSKPKGTIVSNQKKAIDQILNFSTANIKWSDLGCHSLWNFTNPKNYLHLEVQDFCPLSYHNYKKYFLNDYGLDLENKYMFVFFNEMLYKHEKGFLSLSKDEIMSKDNLLSKIFKEAMS